MKIKPKDILYITVIIILLLLISKCKYDEVQAVSFNEVYADSLRVERNEHNQEIASRKSFEVSSGKQFSKLSKELAKKDKTIAELKIESDTYKNRLMSATSLRTTTSLATSSETTVSRHDTIHTETTTEIWPEYSSSFKDDWVTWKLKASKDTAHLNLTVNNDFTISQVKEKDKGFLKFRKSSVVKVRSLNPYTSTTDVRSLTITERPKRFHLGITAGVNQQLQPSINFGIGYSLVRF